MAKFLTPDLYFVHYVEDSTPKLKYFTSLQKAKAFILKIEKMNRDCSWIDFVIKGKLVEADGHYLNVMSM